MEEKTPRLTKQRQEAIDSHIADLFLATNKSYPDYPLTEIVEQYGMNVGLYDFDDTNVMGVIKYPEPEEQSSTFILVNRDKTPEDRTFALAHLLGHYVLHPHDESTFRLDLETPKQDDSENKIEETEANYFAASLLMPENLLMALLNQTSNLDAVAKYFGVSKKALNVRIAWLRQN